MKNTKIVFQQLGVSFSLGTPVTWGMFQIYPCKGALDKTGTISGGCVNGTFNAKCNSAV